MRVFVTGASGFIGSAVVRELLQHGHEVVGLVRSEEGIKRLEAWGAAALRGSIEELKILHRGASEADAVVHTAFFHKFSHAGPAARLRITLGGSLRKAPARFMAAAVETDKRAIAAFGSALEQGGRTLVIAIPTMTLAPGTIATENDAGDPASVGGGRVASEQALLALADRGIRASLVRLPPIVYGEGDTAGLLPSLIRITRAKGAAAYIGEGGNRWPAVHRLDAARLFRLAAEHGATGAKFHAVSSEGTAFREIAAMIGQQINLPVKSVGREQAGAHFGWLGEFAAADNPVSSSLTRQRLGWQPVEASLEAELARNYYFRS
ncbi:SDR family oxidoreductase [Saccharibacillus sp. CPCC 101409]|uniref:SDR family oxidoreductase n=1 Tax=Saccharibacillus sp. CPCC 101409 TaxID=3058041 RepID=UPI002671E9AA|nr:SDR family oxidoreductase [Saccharibacillus sp. CPCC 101409]MDO3408596.1 SDR family oxidoreductase [Saccharibacillus sp. CPCC 101409]